MSNFTINVLATSSDNVVHESWRNALVHQGGITLMHGARNTPDFLSALQQAIPDVFLLDSQFQFSPGALLLPRLHMICPQLKTILFCDVVGHREALDATAHGIKGLLQKTSPPEHWPKAIRVVHEGGIWIGRQLMADALQVLLHLPGQPQLLHELDSGILTKREWEVVHWVSLGMTNKEIARKMTISDNTVKTHLQHVFSKLRVGRRLRLSASLAALSASA
jgi:DNA-binding NarL/FixJ family response regulator